MTADRPFIDTNVIVYAFDDGEAAKQAVARELLAAQGAPVVSTQVVQEFYVAATRKLRIPHERAAGVAKTLCEGEVIAATPAMVLEAIELSQHRSVSFWDALILRAAATAGCDVLLTEDMQDGATIDGVRIENPFASLAR